MTPRSRRIRPRPLVALLSLLLAVLMFAAAPRRASAAGMLVNTDPNGGALDIQSHAVKVTINNGVAVTQVEQVFLNKENRQVEALYTFPVPRNASVANFSMWINGKEMVGEVVEKQRAREIYNSYKQVRRDPGLLEQVDYKTFEMRVFPIAPRAEQRVQVTYYQELDVDHDWATFVYPLATVTRRDITQRTTGRFALSLEAKSEVPIAEMSSPSHGKDFAIAKHTPNYCQASFETSGGDLSRDLVIAYRLERPRTGTDLITSKQAGEDGYFCLTLTAGPELEAAAGDAKGADYVFLVDVSGSMGQDDKLRTSASAVKAFVDALGDNDRFEVMTFNVSPSTLFRELKPADADNLTKAARFLDTQEARGGTILRPAMAAAYRYAQDGRPLNVVVLSDGMTEQGERPALLEAIAQRPQGSRVFCIGVGNEVNRALLEQLAEDTGGLAAMVSAGDDFARQAQGFRRKLTKPAAGNVKIAFEGAKVYDVEPEKLPDLYHGSPIRLYGRYKDAGAEAVKVTLSADVLGNPITQSVDVALPDADPANPEIERMWAWHRVQRLLKEADRGGSRSGVTDEIVRLGEGYSIATEYTSFIVLENDGEYQRWKIDRRNALRIERDRAAQQAVAARLENLRLKSARELGPVDRSAPIASAQPVATNQPQAMTPSTPTGPAPQPRGQSFDFHVPSGGGGGGGAFDPITVAIGLGAVSLVLGAARKSKRQPGSES